MQTTGFDTIMRSIDIALDRRKLGLAFGGALAFIIAGALFAFLGIAVSDEIAVSVIFFILGAIASWVLYALFSGAITHMSWQDLTQGRRPSASESLAFSWSNILSLLFSPLALVLLGVLFLVVEVLILFLGRIPYLGEILVSLAFLPLVIINMLLIIGVVAGTWLIFPIIAAKGSGVVETLERVISIVRHSPMRLVVFFALALIVIIFTLAVLWSLVGVGRFLTVRVMNAGVGEKTMFQIATSNPFGALALPGAAVSALPGMLLGEVIGSLPEPLNSLLGSQDFFGLNQGFEEPRFTMNIAGFIMGLSTVALLAGLVYVFPWVFTLTVGCSIYHSVGDEAEVGSFRKIIPSIGKSEIPAVQEGATGQAGGSLPYQPPSQPGSYQPPEAGSSGSQYQPPSTVPEVSVSPSASGMTPCIECKRDIKTSSRFCPYCGASQN